VIGLECISNDKVGWSITPPQDHNEPLGILILKYETSDDNDETSTIPKLREDLLKNIVS